MGFLAAIVISFFAASHNFFYIASIKNDNSMSAITQNSDGHGQDRDSAPSNQTRAAEI
jgi:hypothetical protein